MQASHLNTTGAIPANVWPPGIGEIVAWNQSWLQAQGLPWQMAVDWQRSMAALQQEMWDEWVSRWGGGVPIDR